MSVVRDLWRLLDTGQRRRVLMAQVISLLMAFFTLAGIAAISPFFAVLGEPELMRTNRVLVELYRYFGFQTDRHFIVALGLGFAGVALLGNVINWAGSYAMQRVALGIGEQMRTLLFKEYLHRSVLYHAGINSATLCSNVAYETERGIVTTLESTFALITNVLTAGLIIGTLLVINPIAATAIVAALGGGYCGIYLCLRRRVFRAGRRESALVAARMKLMLESFGAIKEITLMHVQSFFQERFARSSGGLSRLTAYIDAVTHGPRYVMEGIAAGGLVAIALVLSEPAGGAGRWLAQLTFLGFAVYRFLPALQQVFASMVRIRAAGASFALVAADLRQAREQADMPMIKGDQDDRLRSDLRLSGVSFRYAGSARLALDNLSLHITPGGITGLIGSNGSGKTTLVDILAGLLIPDSGDVLIEGTALRENTRAAWQSRIAYVSQSTFLLDASIAENIALGIDPPAIDRERLRAAARLAHVDEFAALLPQGYDEVIGERGVRLSGGQRQRIGIARGLYAKACLLIMDEATNALDAHAEAEVMAAIQGLRGAKTIIVISHHMRTLHGCDVIYELDQGKLARGSTWNERAVRSVTAAAAGI